MIKKTTEEKKTPLQWHPAFYAEIQIELEEELDELTFENEHQLGTKPKEIDVLIIKKNAGYKVRKNIGRIFRQHNILEYKSPTDYLSIDDFSKVMGYAYFYKADVTEVNAIDLTEITITYVCHSYPRELFRYLTETLSLELKEQENGIYYLEGMVFPIQFLLTSRLSKEKNFWLRSLTNQLEAGDVERLSAEYDKKQNNPRYQAVMDIIVQANQNIFEEELGMCDALMELFREKMEKEVEERLEKQVAERTKIIKQASFLETAQKMLEKGKLSIEEIADYSGLTIEQVKNLAEKNEIRN